jgi:cell shape-determining protein MreC
VRGRFLSNLSDTLETIEKLKEQLDQFEKLKQTIDSTKESAYRLMPQLKEEKELLEDRKT